MGHTCGLLCELDGSVDDGEEGRCRASVFNQHHSAGTFGFSAFVVSCVCLLRCAVLFHSENPQDWVPSLKNHQGFLNQKETSERLFGSNPAFDSGQQLNSVVLGHAERNAAP